ncbi:hypothetical protein Tco_1153671 [Tanacetum coccineum]
MAQKPMKSEEELCPRDKGVAVSISNLMINPNEIHAKPLFNLTLDILKQHSIFNPLTLRTDDPEIYMQQFTDSSFTSYGQQTTSTLEDIFEHSQQVLNREILRFQINSKNNKAKKQEQLPYPRFIKHIINHLLLQNDNLNKQSDSVMHKISEEELVEKLKFVDKGEPKGKPAYGMPIPEVMLSKEIKESIDYINYLAKSRNAQSGAPTLGSGQVANNLMEDPDHVVHLVMLVSLEENKQRGKERRSKARHAALVVDKEVNKEVDIAYNDQLKLKLKAQEQVSPEAQLLLNLKKGAKASREAIILKQILKGPREGSSAIPDSPDHRDNDDDFNKDFDFGKDQTEEVVSRYLNETLKVEMTNLMHEPIYTKTQTLMVVPLLDTILKVHEEPLINQVIDSPPATTINTTPTKSKKKRAKTLVKKVIQQKNDSKKAIMQKLEEDEQKLYSLA